MFEAGLATIRRAGEAAGRDLGGFGLALNLFCRIDGSREAALGVAAGELSKRYGMDFRRATERYCAVGTTDDVIEKVAAFQAAGVRRFVIDMIAPREAQFEQLERFSAEVMPALAGGT